MKNILAFVSLMAVSVAPVPSSFAGNPIPDLGEPSSEMKKFGVVFKVFEKDGLKIVTITPPKLTSPAFMSFVNVESTFKESDVQDFLKGFSSLTGVNWSPLDKEIPASTLNFFLTPPSDQPENAERVLATSPNPEAVRQAWGRLSKDEQARADAIYFLESIEAQRQIWIADEGGYIVVWSEDGKTIGVGILPSGP